MNLNMAENIITIKNLHKSYGELNILKGIDLTIRKGNIFCLLGSNGAGKTTMVNILSTLIQPDSGEIRICGYDLNKQAQQVRQQISMTGQYAAVDEMLTGRENMHMVGQLFRTKNLKERTEELLGGFDLLEAADRRAGTYSGGMRRKLDIAMSLMGNPQVLFLDEPTTGLDPQNRLSMWKEIQKLKEQGVTIFLTTQYLEEAEQLSDYVVILNNGQIAASGTVEELKGLLPESSVVFTFDKDAYNKAASLFQEKQLILDDEKQSITVLTSGSVEEMTELFLTLKNNAIPIKSFLQNNPTLEDVFLAQINREAN
jgi:ABC-2 type transport system ATP-binding protein